LSEFCVICIYFYFISGFIYYYFSYDSSFTCFGPIVAISLRLSSWMVNFALFRCYRPVIYTRPQRARVFCGTIIIASDRRSEVTIWEIDSVRSCVTACCEAAR